MASEAVKPHLSATQLESYCRCPEAYRRRYLEREVIPPGIAIIQGKSFHSAAATNFEQKIESRADLPVEMFKEAAAAAFDEERKNGFCLTSEEESLGIGKVMGAALDKTVELIELHAKEQAPDYQPILVEEEVRIPLPGERDLLAIIDLADELDRVTDFKSASKRKPQSEADGSVQLTIYAAAFQRHTGRPPSELRLDTAVKNKEPVRQVLTTQRTRSDFEALANRINAVSLGIAKGSFPPATPGAWWCTSKWCGYWHTCPYVNSERRAAAESAE